MNKKNMVGILLLLVMIIPSNVMAKDTAIKYFSFDRSTGAITDYHNSGPKDVVIPSEINGAKVTSIGHLAFSNKNIKSVKLPNTITKIDSWAFLNNDIKTLEIPNSVASIGDRAFEGNNIETLYLAEGLKKIGVNAFAFNNLKTLKIPQSVTDIGSVAFQYNNIKDVILSDNLTKLSVGIFQHNNINSIKIPSSVTEIGSGAFNNNNLKTLVLHDNIISIGMSSFEDNELTQTIELPKKLRYIGERAFFNNNFKKIIFYDDIEEIMTFNIRQSFSYSNGNYTATIENIKKFHVVDEGVNIIIPTIIPKEVVEQDEEVVEVVVEDVIDKIVEDEVISDIKETVAETISEPIKEEEKPVIVDTVKPTTSTFIFNGKVINLKEPIITKNNRAYYSFSELLKIFGADLIIDNERRILNGILGDYKVGYKLNSTIYYSNGEEKTFDGDMTTFVNDKVFYVPIRATAESLGYQVGWDHDKKLLTVTNTP